MQAFQTLRPGASGPQTELLQLALRRAGYDPGPIDGVFGPKTLQALVSFQSADGLAADGAAGAQTWAALEPLLLGAAQHVVRPGDTFYKLAQAYGTTIRALETANPDADPLSLQPGSRLTVPFGFPVVSGEIRYTSEALRFAVEGLRLRYPFLSVRSAGKSVMGSPLWLLRMGSGDNQVFYNGTHHANEWIVTPVLLRFLEAYAQAYARGGEIFGQSAETLFKTASLYLLPMVNPDGADLVTGALRSGADYEQAAAIAEHYPQIPFPGGWKANIRGVDPNLQYPALWERAREIKFSQGYTSPAPRDYVGSAPLEAPESRAVYDLTRRQDFALTLSYHTQGQVIYWKFMDYNPPDAERIGRLFASLSGYELADTPYESSFAGYKDWFIQDYVRPGYTIEAGSGTAPLPLSQLDEIYQANLGILVAGLTATAKK